MSVPGPYRDSEVHVVQERCATCIYRPGNLMHLNPGRLRDLAGSAVAEGGVITCHSTLPMVAGDGVEAVCRGFWDAHSDDVPALRLARTMGRVAFDGPRSLPMPCGEGSE